MKANVELLVVEDSPTQSEKLKYLLEERGFRVVLARSGEEALEKVQARKPSLVITDVVMPGMSGYELCRLIKNNPALSDLPVVLLTSLSGPEDVFRGLECGADNFVRKPFDDKYLLGRIDQILTNQDLRSTENLHIGIEITLGNRRQFITAQRQQILDLLISASEEAVRLNEGLSRTNQTLSSLYGTAEALIAARRQAEVCSVALERAMDLQGMSGGWIYLREDDSDLKVVASKNLPERLSATVALQGECPCRSRCLAGTLNRSETFSSCDRLADKSRESPSFPAHVSIPLRIDGRVQGIMNLIIVDAELPDEEMLRLLDSMGNQIGIALDRARLQENLERMVLERTFALTAEIEERKRAQESQTRLVSILEVTTDLVAITDRDGQALYLNKGGRRLLGIPEDEDIATSSVGQFHPDWARARVLDEGFQTALKDSFWSGETALLARDGREIPVSEVVLAHRGREGEEIYFSAIARDITESKHAKEKIETQLERLGSLRAIDLAIASSLDLRVALSIALDQVTSRLHVDAAQVLLLNRETNNLEVLVSRGFRSIGHERLMVRLGDGLAGDVALERKMMQVADLRTDDRSSRRSILAVEQFVAYFAAPLVAHGQVLGVLELFHRSSLTPEPDWLDYFETLAGQAAISADVAQLFERLQRSNTELSLAYDATIEGWSLAMDLRDKETEGHTQRVTELSERFAQRLGLSSAELLQIRRGALLHDIGKMGVPDNILLKAGKLTDEEWSVMRKHPQYAFEMLSPIRYLRGALDIPYCHHEKWDGSGYPRGLKGEQIPLAARLFALVDVWDALRSDRPYRPALSKTEAIRLIREGAGSHFDPELVELFLEMIGQEEST